MSFLTLWHLCIKLSHINLKVLLVLPNSFKHIFDDVRLKTEQEWNPSLNWPAVTPRRYSPLNSPRWPVILMSSSLTQSIGKKAKRNENLVKWHRTGLFVILAARAVAAVSGILRSPLPPKLLPSWKYHQLSHPRLIIAPVSLSNGPCWRGRQGTWPPDDRLFVSCMIHMIF